MNSYEKDILTIIGPDLSYERLVRKKILVTGATGLIGSTLVRVLMSCSDHYDFSVYALGRNAKRAERLFSEYASSTRFHFIQHDIIEPIKSNLSFNYIIHLASGASPNVMANNPVGIMKANLWGTDNLLSYGINHDMQRFLYVSSGEIYGEGDGEVFSETCSGYVNSMLPRSCYPSSKRAAETLCASYSAQYGVDVVVARLCHIYGESFTENDNRAYAQFIRNVVNGEDIVLKSDGMQYRSWLYVDDCVSALLYILLKGVCGEAYNVADENSNLSIRQLAETIAELGGRRVIFTESSENDICGGSKIKRAIFNTEKLRTLGWKPQYSYHEALSKIINLFNYV